MRLVQVVIWLFLITGTAVAGPVTEFTLDNGLKVIVKEDHRAPVVVSQIWYKVGSSYEHRGITGVSHVLEHMMFKGTEKHPAGEFSEIIAANGGTQNAFTGRDFTAYFQQLAADRLEISFELEADRMRNLLLPADEFGKEVKVVMEERRLRTEDKPSALTYERFMANAFITGRYHNPVIGWMDDLEALTRESTVQWYRSWYAPNNATVVVVGDVDPAHVRSLAEKHYGPIEPADVPELKPRHEVPQKGERRITVREPAEVPLVIMGYKVPVLRGVDEQWQPYALEVLAGVLSGGDSARLRRDLVRGQEIATSASAGYDLYDRYPSLLTLSGAPAGGASVAELEKALREQARRLREEPVGAEELARIKAQVAADKVYERDSVFYQAMQIGTLETIGLDWRLADEYTARIDEVTAEQVQQVARKYLIDDRLTVAVLEPLPMDRGTARSGSRSDATAGETE